MKIVSVLFVIVLICSHVKSDHNLGHFMKFLNVMKLNEWAAKERIPRDVFNDYLDQIQRESIKQLMELKTKSSKGNSGGTCKV